MKKKLLVLLLTMTLFTLSACGTNEKKETSSTKTTENTAENEMDATTTDTEETSDLDDTDVNVEKGLFNVEITIPATYIEGQTQEDLEKSCEEEGFKSVTLNEDGSATYLMSKKQHNKMMSEMKEQIDTSLDEMVSSGDYPSFTDIKANDNYSEFTITTTSTELDMTESFSVMSFYMLGGMYNIYNGTDVNNINVKFVNADSGDVISESNSSDMDKTE